MVTHKTFKNKKGEWLSPDEIYYDKGVAFDFSNKEVQIGKIE